MSYISGTTTTFDNGYIAEKTGGTMVYRKGSLTGEEILKEGKGQQRVSKAAVAYGLVSMEEGKVSSESSKEGGRQGT